MKNTHGGVLNCTNGTKSHNVSHMTSFITIWEISVSGNFGNAFRSHGGSVTVPKTQRMKKQYKLRVKLKPAKGGFFFVTQ